MSEPAWPSGKALHWYAEGPRFDSPLWLTFVFILIILLSTCTRPISGEPKVFTNTQENNLTLLDIKTPPTRRQTLQKVGGS